jgi:hypothetical protein
MPKVLMWMDADAIHATIIDWEFQIFYQIVNSNGSTPLFFNLPFAEYVLTLHLTIYNVTSVKNGSMLLLEKSREQESRKIGSFKIFVTLCHTESCNRFQLRFASLNSWQLSTQYHA